MPDFGRTHLYRADPDIVLRLCQRRRLRPISPICLCPWSKGASYANACPDPGIWALCKEKVRGERACAPEWHTGCTSPIAPERSRGHFSGILGLGPGALAMGTSPNDPERTRWALLRDFGTDGLGLAECFGARTDGLGLADCFGARRTQVRRRARGVPLHVGPVRRFLTRVGRGPVWVRISYPRQRCGAEAGYTGRA